MYAYKYAYPSVISAGGKLPQGVYACNSSGNLKYKITGATEFSGVTFDSTYNIYWFEVLSDGSRTATTLLTGSPFTLSLGQNLDIPIVGAESSGTVIMYLADTITIDQSSGDSSIINPTLTASISGGAWSSDSSDSLTGITFSGVPLSEGNNSVTAIQTDPNGDQTLSTAIDIVYFKYAPIVAVGGDRDIVNGVTTEERYVDLIYVVGGAVLFDEITGEPLYNELTGELLVDGGTEVTELAVSLEKGVSTPVIGGLTDDFGNTFTTAWPYSVEVTKIPKITNNGLTTIDEETYDTTYAATGILTIDEGQGDYEQLNVTPTEAPYTFTSGDYKVYNFTASHTYTGLGISNSVAYNIDYVEFDLPKILELDGIDVTGGLIPKLNIADGSTIDVKWLNTSNVEQNDTDPVVGHEFSTLVSVTRESTATATYNHKTGLPIPTLLYYRDDQGQRVDFNGVYEIPNTVTVSPITFGWSITNGNIAGEVEQTEFNQVLSVDAENDVVMPAFTDDWGNSATLESRTQSVVYGDASGYEADFVTAYLWDNPFVGSDTADTNDDSGFYTRIGEIISNDGDFSTVTPAERMIKSQSSFLKMGGTFDTSGSQQTRFVKAYTGNEGWFLAAHCFVFNFIGPNVFPADFEYAVMMNDFNTRVLMIRDEQNDEYSVGAKSSSDKATPFSTRGEPQTVLVGVNAAGEIRYETSQGGTFTGVAFGGYPASEMAIGFKFSSTSKQCNVLIHEIGVLPYWPDTPEKRQEIFDRSVKRWFEIPETGDSVFTADGFPAYSAYGFPKNLNP